MIPLVTSFSPQEESQWLQQLTKQIPNQVFKPLAELSDLQRQECELAIVANPDPQALASLPNLVWVQSLWAGVEGMVNQLPDAKFKIVRLIDPHLAETMSEAVLAWTLYLHRDMPHYARQQTHAQWQQRPMVRAKDRRVGILGLGELGNASAQRLAANGFQVFGWSRSEKQLAGVTCFHGRDGLTQLLSQADILVCLLPLTSATLGLLNDDTLSYLPPDAALINFSRGAIIDDIALQKKLQQGEIRHAVLDVFQQEPLPTDNAYWRMKNVTVLPHISAPTHIESACDVVAKNIRLYQATTKIPAAVDVGRGY
ncbi:glyoxylate/hydroxypyruvate reductase A [Marinomonas sp. THO17]|uniref:2-hydroxyacid dehydrogenase n=1 Tax=Marinomonas sp. THO17 TaxID=3149048 RepID=UPI00336C002D